MWSFYFPSQQHFCVTIQVLLWREIGHFVLQSEYPSYQNCERENNSNFCWEILVWRKGLSLSLGHGRRSAREGGNNKVNHPCTFIHSTKARRSRNEVLTMKVLLHLQSCLFHCLCSQWFLCDNPVPNNRYLWDNCSHKQSLNDVFFKTHRIVRFRLPCCPQSSNIHRRRFTKTVTWQGLTIGIVSLKQFGTVRDNFSHNHPAMTVPARNYLPNTPSNSFGLIFHLDTLHNLLTTCTEKTSVSFGVGLSSVCLALAISTFLQV